MITTLDPPRVVKTGTNTAYDTPPDIIQPSPWLLVAIGAATATSVILGGIAAPMAASTVGTSISSRNITRPAPALTESSAETIRRVRDASGLTWEQLAKVFGVSRRAVHHWASGERLSPTNAALLAEFDRLVCSIGPADPAEVRQRLLAPGKGNDGDSVIDSFRKYVEVSYAEVQPRPAPLEAVVDPS